jgi:anti-sigma factor RsiW
VSGTPRDEDGCGPDGLYGRRLKAWSDGELPPAASRKVADHVDSCEDCTRMLEDFRTVSSLFESSGELNPGRAREITRRAMATVREERETIGALQRIAVAAAIVLALTSGWLVTRGAPAGLQDQEVVLARDTTLLLVLRPTSWEEEF